MTHTPETRTTYWWTHEQLVSAGWEKVWLESQGDYPPRCRTGYRSGATVVLAETDAHMYLGAYLPEPPPPESLSDEEIRDHIYGLRHRSTSGHMAAVDLWAADVIEAALAFDAWKLSSDFGAYSRTLDAISEALRRRPR